MRGGSGSGLRAAATCEAPSAACCGPVGLPSFPQHGLWMSRQDVGKVSVWFSATAVGFTPVARWHGGTCGAAGCADTTSGSGGTYSSAAFVLLHPC